MIRLEDLPCFGSKINIAQIAAGHSHECYKVTSDGKTFFAKCFSRHSITANAEVNASLVAAKQGIAPKVIYYDENWLVSSFIEQSIQETQQKIEAGLVLMTKLHQTQVALPTLDIVKTINDLSQRGLLTKTQLSLISMVTEKLSSILIVKELVPCHGDINFSNLLITGQSRYLVDFECACLADREFDIAMLIAINQLDITCLDDICQAYGKLSLFTDMPDNDLVMRYLLFCFLINGLWFLVRAKQNNDESLSFLAFEQFQGFDLLKFVPEQLSVEMR